MHPAHRGYSDIVEYRDNQTRYGVAFVFVTAIAFGASLVAAEDPNLFVYISGWAVALAGLALAWLRPSLWMLAPFGALIGTILVRAGSDGLDAGIGPLLLIPMLAVAVYGSRRALIVMVAVTFMAVLFPYFADTGIESGMTPAWRQDIVMALLITVLGVAIQDLVVRMRRERNLAEERGAMIEELVTSDPLTGIDNRRGWERMIQRTIGQARRHRQPVSLAMLDLDHFKQYNDAYGHQAGDDFLKRTATTWEAMIRIDDHVARYGGEEFVLTLPNTDLDSARVIVDRLRDALPEAEDGSHTRATCSAGIAEWDGSETVRELVFRADRALYTAKKNGRDQTVDTTEISPEPA